MGTAEEIRQKISAILPGVDWSDPTGGFIELAGCSFEFALLGDEDSEDEDEANAGGADARLDGFAIAVRGDGEPLPVLAKLCKPYGWNLGDAGTGEDIDLNKPSDPGWHEFKKFRDSVARKARSPKQGFWSKLFGRRE